MQRWLSDYTYEENLKKLDQISKLEKNWNGYDADPIPRDIIDDARKVLTDIESTGTHMGHILPQPFVAPFADGRGIQLEWENEAYYLEIHIDGSIDWPIFLCSSDSALRIEMEGIAKRELDDESPEWNIIETIQMFLAMSEAQGAVAKLVDA